MYAFATTRSVKQSAPSATPARGHHYNSYNQRRLRNILTPPPTKAASGPKVTIGAANDHNEREADNIADKVMNISAADLAKSQQNKGNSGLSRDIQRTGETCKGPHKSPELQPLSEEKIQAKAQGNGERPAPGHIESAVEGLSTGGTSLSPQDAAFFEPRFGKDFSQVKIHTGGHAEQLAAAINARAFTYGNHIVFGRGEYQPDNNAGKRLMAHELTHVMQQNGQVSRTIRRTPSISEWEVHNTDGTNTAGDNCCALCPRPLGVGNSYSGRITNGIELMPFIAGHEAGATYDIGRISEGKIWERVGGAWTAIVTRAAGTDDDPNNQDECLTPMFHTPRSEYYIYVEDQPGFANVSGLRASATEYVFQANFVESVDITDAGGTTTTDSNTHDWYSVLWLTKTGGAWTVDRTRSAIESGSTTIGTSAP